MVMPDVRRGRELDATAAVLQPPAHVHVIAGTKKNPVEAADVEQGLPSYRQIAAGHVLGDGVVEQHMRRPPRGPRDALGEPVVVRGHAIRAADGHRIAAKKRLNEIVQPVGLDSNVGVDIGHDLAGRGARPDVARNAQTAARNANQPNVRKAAGDFRRRIRRAVVDDDGFD